MASFTLPTSQARERLSMIVHKVQDPRAYCVLTRHGKPVAAIVSMAELRRIWKQQEIEDVSSGRARPSYLRFGKGGHDTNAEAAEAIQEMQLDRFMERQVLKTAGLAPVPGGELEAVTEVPKRRWWQWRGATPKGST
jgi:prevent-host-death family protein